MNTQLPACPKCQSEYVYQDMSLFICPECGYEWDPSDDQNDDLIQVHDANGTYYLMVIKLLSLKI